MADTAYLVRVDLHRLAKSLTQGTGKLVDHIDAARWLITGGKEAVFHSTDEYGLFYTEADPELVLSEEEIKTIRNVPVAYGLFGRRTPGLVAPGRTVGRPRKDPAADIARCLEG